MPEPTTTAAVTLAAATATVPPLIAFGVPLGLRPDVLLAGFSGALVAIILATTVRRMGVVLASSLTAGYVTPAVLHLSDLTDALLLAVSFVVGGGAQQILRALIKKMAPAEAV
jgi:hypothetical protein